MSWYTHFKLKEDSQYKNMTIDECNRRLKNDRFNNLFSRDYRAELLATMIQAYYEPDVNKKRSMIASLVILSVSNENIDYEYVKDALEDKDGIISVNHCPDEYTMQERVDTWDDSIKRTISDLVILATIRFEPDNRYSDTDKTTMDYLRYSYINEINEKMDCLDDEAYDYYRYKFLIEECDKVCDDSERVEDILKDMREPVIKVVPHKDEEEDEYETEDSDDDD